MAEYEPQLMGPVAAGPLSEASQLSSGLDYYKPTMSQVQYEQYPDVEVTFTLHNRGPNQLSQYVKPSDLQARLNYFGTKGWSDEELDFLARQTGSAGEPLFDNQFLDNLAKSNLPPVNVGLDDSGELWVTAKGDWPLVTFWETVVMSEINELYFENMIRQRGLDLNAIYDEGDRRLSEKIAILKDNPDIKFADFGTRRRFSLRWHKHVIGRLINECPSNLIGTSNVNLARINEIWPIGTHAHEMPMVYAAIADATDGDIRSAQGQFFDDWTCCYNQNLSTALTDTYTTDFFFEDFGSERAAQWRGLRQDSGDPYEFGEKAIAFYESLGIDPNQKTIVFSDGLDINTIVNLHKYFKPRINVVFGWGTSLTNDLGLEACNIVMKATHIRLPSGEAADAVKLSETAGKATGPPEQIEKYNEIFVIKKPLTVSVASTIIETVS